MRTTVTLDPDTRLLVERLMRERDIGFKEALNEAIRAGFMRDGAPVAFTRPRALGSARVDLTRALGVAAELEDEATTRAIAEGR